MTYDKQIGVVLNFRLFPSPIEKDLLHSYRYIKNVIKIPSLSFIYVSMELIYDIVYLLVF